jgi:hypothetical protein
VSIATVRDLIEQERLAGASDLAIAALLRASSITPPMVHRSWTEAAVAAVAGAPVPGMVKRR